MISLKTKNWQIENIETVFFDKDGTFIDLHFFWGQMTKLRALEVIKRFNLSKDCFNQLCLYLGYDLNSGKMLKDGITALYSRSKIIEIFKNNLKEINIETTEDELAKIFDYVSEIFYQDMFQYVKPIGSAIEFIKKLYEKNIKLGIITSDSVESTNLTLKHFSWEKYFDVVIGRESTKETKESGVGTKLALEKINANSKTTIMIGDAPMDFISAKNAGIEKTILVSSGQIEIDELKKVSNYCVNSLDEIEIL